MLSVKLFLLSIEIMSFVDKTAQNREF